MRSRLIPFAMILFSLFFITQQGSAKKPNPESLLFNSAQGHLFYIAVPPNEVPGYSPNVLEVYITSAKDCNVTMEVPGTGYIKTKPVKALQITTFSSTASELDWVYEIRESEKVTNLGIKFTADQPISLYCLNGKSMTSEGFLGIPVSGWGTEYIHCSYYDFNEVQEWASGFIIVSGENNTRVNIALNGRGSGQTLNGHKIGDKWNISLEEGQTYMVRGDGKTRGTFDMTGSRFVGNKPFGLISFHMRTIIPSFDIYNGRDHLSEMMPPVTAWGKKYATVEYKRDSGEGDFFRVVAAEDNTQWKAKYFHLVSGTVEGNLGGTLKKAGDFYEYLETYATANDGIKSIYGTSVWEADKPILVMQYAYSEQWDGATLFDPFMILVVPVEQFIPSTVFQTPANKAFVTNWFNIVAVHDTTDEAKSDLKSIKIDGQPVWKTEPGFLFNRIPTTDLYWAKIAMEPGAHQIQGDTKFGGYIYGFAQWDSYGWPAAMAVTKLDEVDTLPPQLYPEEDCGDYIIETTELRNGKEGDDPMQIDQGISIIELLEGTDNYELVFPEEFQPWPKLTRYTFHLNVIDKTKDALAYFQVTDRYSNYVIDSVRYEAATLETDPELLAFGNVRLGTSKTLLSILKNTSDSIITVSEIKMKFGDYYEIVDGAVPPMLELAPADTHHVWVKYTPENEGLTADQKDLDSIVVTTECLDFIFPVEGRGVVPRIIAEDHDFGPIVVGTKICKIGQTNTGIEIKNPGTDTLTITDIQGEAAPFELSAGYTPALPIVIPPKGKIFLEDVCFTAPDQQSHQIVLKYICDAQGTKDSSIIKGRGITPGPYITNYDWKERRVGTINQGEVYIKNSGNTDTYVQSVELGNTADQNFRITGTDPTLPSKLSAEGAGSKDTMITVFVEFEPVSEGPLNNTVVPVFDDTNIPVGSVVGQLDGIGILPHIEVIGYKFEPSILVNTEHPDEGVVTIKSTSQSADLYIESIGWDDATQSEYEWLDTPPSDITLPRGEEITLRVKFTPNNTGRRVQTVNVVNDAAPGPQTDPRITTDTIVEGTAYDEGIVVDEIDYGNVLLCDNPELPFHVFNTSTTGDATIDSIVIIEDAFGAFELVTTNYPITVPAEGDVDIMVRFIPPHDATFAARARVYTSIGSDYYAELRGVGYTVPVTFKLTRWTQDYQSQQGVQLAPGTIVNFNVSGESNKWNDAEVTEVHMEILYRSTWMQYTNNVAPGQNLSDWTIDAQEVRIDDEWTKLVLNASGTKPIDADYAVIKPEFMLLLSDVTEFEPQIDINTLSLGSRDQCVVTTEEPGYAVLNTCVIDLRGVIFSTEGYFLQQIDPNPVSSNTVDIRFVQGLRAHTNLEIFNSMGSLVKVVVSEERQPGQYTETVDISDLPSGAYTVRMNSSNFTETKSLVITK